MKKIVLIAFMAATLLQAGWNPFEDDSSKSTKTSSEISKTIKSFKQKDSNLKLFFNKAYGYAVFPEVGKAGIGIGGAYGSGKVFKRGKAVANVKLTQLTIGFQLGGQVYSEVIFFKDKSALNKFLSGNFELGAQASAVALTTGASADADYSNGVAIFTMAKGGLMYEASVGGQKFSIEKF